MALELGPLVDLAGAYLTRQAWYGAYSGKQPGPFSLISFDVVSSERPALGRVLLSQGERAYQLLIGWRASSEIGGLFVNNEQALIGAMTDDGESVIVYDALFDDELTLRLLNVVSDGRERADRVRTVSTLVSHASLVYDERLFMKCYRVLEHGRRPEVEVSLALDDLGFNALLAPVGHWSAAGYDLAFVREFLPTALEGRLLALTSLRDLLAYAATSDEPSARFGQRTLLGIRDLAEAAASAGGDFSSEMNRLGATTARLHIALASAFGDHPIDPNELSSLAGVVLPDERGISGEVASLSPASLGRAIRLHGDFHLRRVMRSEAGWLVAGFSDDPLYAAGSRASLAPRTGSPLEDVADMCFAIREVAAEAVSMRPAAEAELARALGAAWTRRNRDAFVASYVRVAADSNLLPSRELEQRLLLRIFDAERNRRYEAAAAVP